MEKSLVSDDIIMIKEELIEMTELVTAQHARIAQALENNDSQQSSKILSQDSDINEKFNKITAQLEFLITKTPLGKDLRRTMAYIMIAQDLERIGDYVKYIAPVVETKLDKKITYQILMIHTSFMNFLKELISVINTENYDKMFKRDKSYGLKWVKKYGALYDLTNPLREQIITSIVTEKSEAAIASRVFAMNVIAGIERAVDHIKHICELIDYIKTGKHVDLE